MSSPDDSVVYLEDLEVTTDKRKTAAAPSISSSQSSSASGTTPSAASSSGVKRQRDLREMFPSSQESSSGRDTKKLKTSASATGPLKLNAIPFSLSAFLESLSESDRELLQLECETMGNSWLKMLKDEIRKPYFITLKKFLWEEGVRDASYSPVPLKVFPPAKDIYSWSNTPLGKVKVVIIGQDPYHGRGQAHGLCFSVPPGVAAPPSLENIYTEIKAEYPEFVAPKHGNLSAWAASGVLMLNTCLTVRAHNAASHSEKGWETFTDKVVDVIDRYGGANLPGVNSETGFGRGVVFLAWGAFAAKRVAKLDTTKHLILKSAHPSPHSAHLGFAGNGHFKSANEWLEHKYGPGGMVDWCSIMN